MILLIYSYILAESDITNADHETSVLGRSPKPPSDHLIQAGDRSGQTDLEGFVSFSDSDTIDNLDQRDSNYTNKSISDFAPVEQKSIDRPSDDDWLSWRRTSDGQGFSPLKQINKNIW